jgi:16S rRNA processing protein RimM
VRWNKEFALIKFKGITDAETARRYRGWSLFINSSMLAELPANTYYQFQIQGCRVNDTEGQTLGSVESVVSYPANDVYSVRTVQGKLVDIPAVRELIKNVDVENKVITVYGDKLQEIGE